MGYGRPKTDGQRGAAAVEFALCVPLLLALMTGTLYFGLALLSRLELTYLAAATARTCVLEQYGSNGIGSYSACAESAFSTMMTLTGMNPCDGHAPSLSVNAGVNIDGSIPPVAASEINLLQVQAFCNKTISPLVNANSSGTGSVPGTVTIYGRAAMPFVVASAAR